MSEKLPGLGEMYDDERRGKMVKPLSWEEIVEQEWEAEDQRLFTLEEYKKHLKSKAPKISANIRIANEGKEDVFKDFVPLKKDKAEIVVSKEEKTTSNKKKEPKARRLQDVAREIAKAEEEEQKKKKKEEPKKERDMSILVPVQKKPEPPPRVQLPQCPDWNVFYDAVNNRDLQAIQDLASKYDIAGYKILSLNPYKVHNWNDTAHVNKLMCQASLNKDISMINFIHNWCPNQYHWFLRDAKSPVAVVLERQLAGEKYEDIIEHLMSLGRHHYTDIPALLRCSLKQNNLPLLRTTIADRGQNAITVFYSNTYQNQAGFQHNAYHYAAMYSNKESFDLLYTRFNKEENTQILEAQTTTTGYSDENRGNETPLHIAAKCLNIEAIDWLLAKDINPTILDIDGKTCADLASDPDVKKKLNDAIARYNKKFTRINPYTNEVENFEWKTKAIVRLMKDYKELIKHPMPTIQAAPLEHDIFRWHVIFTSPERPESERDRYPYSGIRLHFVIQFPEDYPRTAPTIAPSTYIKHPNIFGGYICLDMLARPYIYYDHENEKWIKGETGWTAAYSISSILMQLQAFLFDTNVPQYGYTTPNVVSAKERLRVFQEANEFGCEECGYNLNFKVVNKAKAAESKLRAEIELDEGYETHHLKLKNYIPGDEPTNKKKRNKKNKKKNTQVPDEKVEVAPTKVDSQPQVSVKDLKLDSENQSKNIQQEVQRKFMQNHATHITDSIRKLKNAKPEPIVVLPYNGPDYLTKLPEDLLVEILDYMQKHEDLSALLRSSRRIRDVSRKYSIWTRRELLCFYSKRSFHEDVLGIGLYVERHKNSDKLKTISSPLDLISKTAFLEDELRNSAWQEKFHYWMPVPINERHSKMAMPVIKSLIVAIVKNINFEPKVRLNENERKKGPTVDELQVFENRMETLRLHFDPLQVLDILPRLMNHMVVALMKEDDNQGIIPLHASEKALLGYCTYHHILLNLVNEFPEIQKHVDHYLNEFMKHESRRVKKVIPDLGEMLVRLSIASTWTWDQVAKPFLQEFFDRTVMWTLDYRHGNHGELAFLETDDVSDYRLLTTLQTTKTSTRLLMFQVFFLRNVGRPKGQSLASILQQYNNSYGHPQPGVPEKLQAECKKIYKVNTWKEFYERIGITPPSKQEMTSLLRDNVRRSEKKGYHVLRMSQTDLFKWRAKLDLGMKTLLDAASPSLSAASKIKSTESKINIEESVANLIEQQKQIEKEMHANKKWIKIFVGNLSFHVNSDELAREFQQFGHLVKAFVPVDERGKNRGFGFVIFDDKPTVDTVMEYMAEAEIDGRKIKLDAVKNDSATEGSRPKSTIKEKYQDTSFNKNPWSKVKTTRPNVGGYQNKKTTPIPQQKGKEQTQVPTTRKEKAVNPFEFLSEE